MLSNLAKTALIAISALSVARAYAQAPEKNTIPAVPASQLNIPATYVPASLDLITALVLIFGLIALGLQTFLLIKARCSAEDVLRNFTVTTVVTLGVALIAIGYNQQQIAPITGLFGTIVGFLLGQRSRPERDPRRDELFHNQGDRSSKGVGQNIELNTTEERGKHHDTERRT